MKEGEGRAGERHAPESDIVCQYCGCAEFHLHGIQQQGRISVVCTNCKAQVAYIIDWMFSDARKEKPHEGGAKS